MFLTACSIALRTTVEYCTAAFHTPFFEDSPRILNYFAPLAEDVQPKAWLSSRLLGIFEILSTGQAHALRRHVDYLGSKRDGHAQALSSCVKNAATSPSVASTRSQWFCIRANVREVPPAPASRANAITNTNAAARPTCSAPSIPGRTPLHLADSESVRRGVRQGLESTGGSLSIGQDYPSGSRQS